MINVVVVRDKELVVRLPVIPINALTAVYGCVGGADVCISASIDFVGTFFQGRVSILN